MNVTGGYNYYSEIPVPTQVGVSYAQWENGFKSTITLYTDRGLHWYKENDVRVIVRGLLWCKGKLRGTV